MSMDLKMSIRNIWRNPRRTLLTLAAIAFACIILVFMLSFQFGSYETMINATVKTSTGHLQIQARGYHEKNDISLTVQDLAAVHGILDTIREIQGVSARGEAFCVVSSKDRTRGVLVVGIDPGNEPRVSTLDQLIREGSFLSKGDSGKALAGKLLARYLKTDIGDELTLLGQGKDGSIAATLVTVRGIYSSGMDDFDRSALQIPLKDFQDLFTMGGDVHRIVLTLDGLNFVNTVKTQIQKAFEKNGLSKALVVLDWKELMPGLVQGIKIDLASGIIFYMILVIIVAFSILNTFLMALFERTREFGILLAMGASPGRLFKVLFMESILLTLAGTLIGICIGSGITLYFQTRGIMIAGASEMLSQYGITGLIHPKLTLISMVTGPGLVILITLFAALYPAVKVKKLKPLDALTQRGY